MMRYLALMALAGLAACAGSGTSTPTFSGTMPTPNVVPSQGAPDDRLRVGDLVVVQLSGVPTDDQFIQQMKVDESGSISLPYIGSIPVAGQTTVQVKERAEALYKMGRYFTNPNITVTSQQQRFVSVNGEVRTPQRILHQREMTAMGAIASCGGFTEYANKREIRLLRGGQVLKFSAVEILKDPSRDIPLLPDDIIQVDRSIF